MRRLLVLGAMGALALGLTSVAGANEIDVDKAKKVTERVAKQLCADDDRCQSYTARYCDKADDHNAKCIAFHVIRTKNGKRKVCRTPVQIDLSHSTGEYSVDKVGKSRCR